MYELKREYSIQIDWKKLKKKHPMVLQSINSNYKWNKKESVRTVDLYNKFINWVNGEFDLYLITESNILVVYFPNGRFSIVRNSSDENDCIMEITVEGRSKTAFVKIKNQLAHIYDHLMEFQEYK